MHRPWGGSSAKGQATTACGAGDAAKMQSVEELQGGASEDAGDAWRSESSGMLRRMHVIKREHLFTPFRVAGSPPGRDLYSVRVTEGTYESGIGFKLVDSWRNRHDAHARLQGKWTGSTTFYLKPISKRYSANEPQ